MRIPSVVICLAVMSTSIPCGAQQLLDQSQTVPGLSLILPNESQQGITAGIAGQLTQVDVFVWQVGTATFFVNVGPPWQSDTDDFTTIFAPSSTGWNSIDVSAANIGLNVGDHFVIGFDGTPDLGIGVEVGFDPYSQGVFYIDGSPEADWDLAFRTYMTPIGACCQADGMCVDDVLEAACTGLDTWFDGQTCLEIPTCEPVTVPTVSEWGLIAMGALLVGGLGIVLRRPGLGVAAA